MHALLKPLCAPYAALLLNFLVVNAVAVFTSLAVHYILLPKSHDVYPLHHRRPFHL